MFILYMHMCVHSYNFNTCYQNKIRKSLNLFEWNSTLRRYYQDTLLRHIMKN